MVLRVAFIDKVHSILSEKLSAEGVICDDLTPLSRKDVLERIADYDGIVIRSKFPVNKDFLDKARNLKFVARSGAGMENIDQVYAGEKGVKLYNSPEGNRTAVAEHAIAMLLSLFNHLNRADAEVRLGLWRRAENRGHELKGKCVAIVGYGNMGRSFAKRLQGFGVEVIAYDKYLNHYGDDLADEANWEDIYDRADVLSLHVPQAEDTLHMIDRERISKMKKPFYLINTARGSNVSISDLMEGLDTGKVLGACLDVNEFEGSSFEALHSKDENYSALLKSDRVLLSPHIAGWTHESYLKLAEILFKKISADFLN